MSVICTPTGFPQLDVILHSQLKGLPHGRDIEIFSKEPEVGKTSLGLQILQHWQTLGKRTLIIDVERTITVEFLNQLGIITTTDDPAVPAVRISRPADGLTAEQVLDLVKGASNVFDLIVVDSIGAMDIKANLEKESDENNKIGAMALLLSNFMKRNTAKRATVVWINQTRQIVGGYNPTGQIRYATMGGRALGFFGSIRLDLSVIEKLKDANEDVYAMKVKVYTNKNKVSPQFKSAILTYVMGEGFSVYYDYFDMGLKLEVISKKGGWYQYGDVRIQGDLNFYRKMKTNPDLFTAIKNSIAEELASHGAASLPSDN
jgi:recombination protein RecA